MITHALHRFRLLIILATILAALAAGTLSQGAAATASAPDAARAATAVAQAALAEARVPAAESGPGWIKPAVVLVHGAFADASGWAGVITRLQRQGYPVIAPANPLRGVASDSAYIASVLHSIQGPIVMVGHSYGGEVMTNAATGNPNVKALVYIAAFAPNRGETSGQLSTMFPGSQLTPENLVFRPFPLGGEEFGVDAYINPARFREIFCADLPASTASVMAAAQRPGALSTLDEPSGAPAWKRIPSWYLVAKQDRAIPPAAQRFMAERMNAQTWAIDSSHVAMTSHPAVASSLVRAAAWATH